MMQASSRKRRLPLNSPPFMPRYSHARALEQVILITTRQDLEARLRELNLAFETHDHAAVFTVAESSELHESIPGAHTKNLFLKDAKGRLFLIIAHHATKIALKKLHKKLGSARLSFGKPELLLATLGVTPGSVNAFAIVNDLEGKVAVVLDETLQAHDIINAHPMDNKATTSIARADLLRFLTAHDHEPTVCSLSDDC